MQTTVFLIRHGVTAWNDHRKVMGQRDVPLSDRGMAQAEAAAAALDGLAIAEVVSSPLQRAVQTAEVIGRRFGIEVARDPRLTDLSLGKWTGCTYEEVSGSPEYQLFLDNPLKARIPDGESLEEVRGRAVAAVEQALEDSPAGDAIAVVSHAGVIRVLLTHYLGSQAANYHRLRVSSGSLSVLSFSDGRELPRVLAFNWVAELLGAVRH